MPETIAAALVEAQDGSCVDRIADDHRGNRLRDRRVLRPAGPQLDPDPRGGSFVDATSWIGIPSLMTGSPDTGRVQLIGEQQTMLMTLYLHARDARSAEPVLDDRFAAPILAQVEHDESAMSHLRGNQPLIVGRATIIDTHVRSFLARSPDAVVLHLGCGLDSRVLRIDPGPDVTWIEVDQEPVITLRRRFYPERDGVVTVAGSVTDTRWWSDVPTGRPLLVVAEGLLMYLPPSGVRTVCDRITERDAPTTTLLADTVAPWVRRVAGWQPTFRQASTGFASTTHDLDAAMARHPRFARSVDESLVTAAAHATSGPLAHLIGLLDRLPAGHRAMTLRRYTTASAG